MAKICKSYILILPYPQGHVMSVKCEEPIDQLTVQIWLLYHHRNFKYCTLFASGTEIWTDRQTNGQMDGRTIQLLDAPADLSGRGHKKNIYFTTIKPRKLRICHSFWTLFNELISIT